MYDIVIHWHPFSPNVRRYKVDLFGDKKGDIEEYRWLEVESSRNHKTSWNMKEAGSKALGEYGGVSGAVYDSQRLDQGERIE